MFGDRRQLRGAKVAFRALALGASVLGALGAGESPARAQDLAMAEQLFAEGKALMKSGETTKACEKFKASHDIDQTATGTLLNLALCHEADGKTASAWAEFRQVIAESASRADRIVLAREHESKLFPRLAYVIIAVRPAARIEGMRITLDGRRAVPPAAWDADLPIDPGHHTLDVDAAGMTAKRYEIDVPDAPGKQTVNIEPLVAAPQQASDHGPTAAGTADSYDSPALRAAEAERLRKRRLVGFVLTGAGVVSASVGGVFGALAINQNDKKNAACGTFCNSQPDQTQARNALDKAKTDALVSDITIGAGAALIVAGAVLVITSSPKTKPAASALGPLNFSATANAHGGGLFLERAF
jgi:hypothetical protein